MLQIKEVIGHQVKRTAGVVSTLAIIGIIGFIGWSIYAGVIKPVMNPEKTTTQKAGQINNPHYNPRPGFGGCAHMTIHENYGKKEKK